MKLWRYLFLPREITDFERSYLRRMNRIALVFFYLHLPAFIAVAALAGTSILQAAILTPLVLVGPTIVYFWFSNPRALAVAYGFTATVMGGLLVHFGQGPMQIEMHFYFFVLIALLAVFGNPAAIMTAAVTVALHHLTLWLVLPSSVFNYEASAWAVVVHAAFVVLESVAATFVARSFFDNVIGLERIVATRTIELDRRNRDMALVLGNVGQGFVTIGGDGVMSAERSAILASWLGPAPASGRFVDHVARLDPRFAASFELGWGEVFGGIMPLELTLGQLPRRIDAGRHHLQLDYRPIGDGDVPDSVLVVVSDITAELERESAEAERRELMAVFERISTDRNGFVEFCDEADELVRGIAGDAVPAVDLQRRIHTSTFVHAVRNAIDHGIEDVAERQRQGKPDTAQLSLRSTVENGALVIEIRDDGRGIHWDRVRERARGLGIASETPDDLVEALFAEGVSTKDEVTDLSGRGVGLSALRAAARTEGGRLAIASVPRHGTSLRFEFPLDRLAEREFLTDLQAPAGRLAS
jgi:two-component system chemotaxis sensor kinase CheA